MSSVVRAQRTWLAAGSRVWRAWSCALCVFVAGAVLQAGERALVLQTDFGLKDGAVAAMRGIVVGVSPRVSLHDLSHENTPFNIWEGAYRLRQAAPYWPAGTVFVSVIDPGVGTARQSIVLKTKSGHFFVSPDNGTLMLIADDLGIEEVRTIDEARQRRPGSEKSHTFHGRDIFAFVGARLAAGDLKFEDVGPRRPARVARLAYEPARRVGQALQGTVVYLDFQFGNVWTDLDETLLTALSPRIGDRFRVTIAQGGRTIYTGEMPYVRTFGDVSEGAPLLYLNSLLHVSFALNADSFVRRHGVGFGTDWTVRVEKLKP